MKIIIIIFNVQPLDFPTFSWDCPKHLMESPRPSLSSTICSPCLVCVSMCVKGYMLKLIVQEWLSVFNLFVRIRFDHFGAH